MAAREAKIKEIVEHPDTHATCLLVLCLDQWGTAFFEWEPDTLIRQALQDWHAQIPEKNRDKIWALVTHLTTDLFTSSLDGFIHVCNALQNAGASFEQFMPAGIDALCWGITEASLIEPVENFNDEIRSYIEARLEYEGFHQAPRVLKPYVTLTPERDGINANLDGEGIAYETFWENEKQKSVLIDEEILTGLKTLFFQLEQLPLQHANQANLRHILKHARAILEEQARTTTSAAGLVPQPLL